MDKFAEILKNIVKEQYEKSQNESSKMNRLISVIAFVGIIFFTAFALMIVRSIKRPIKTIVDAAEHVAGGDFTQSININSEDEKGKGNPDREQGINFYYGKGFNAG
ncbi:MAG: HAMP domain-containing protein [Nitrospirota bacterium]